MKTFVALAVFSLALIQGSSAINCFQCQYNDRELESATNQAACANDNGDDVDATLSQPCDADAVACYVYYIIDEDDHESYVRDCVTSLEQTEVYNKEDDKCFSYEEFGREHHHCICDENDCNGGGIAQMSLVLMVSAVLKQIVL